MSELLIKNMRGHTGTRCAPKAPLRVRIQRRSNTGVAAFLILAATALGF